MRISEQTSFDSAQAAARAALSELEILEHDDGTMSFIIDTTAVRVACQLATYDVGLRAGVQFYNPQSTLVAPDAVTTSHVLTMVERARAFFQKHGPVTSDGFVFAVQEKYAQGDRGGHTDLVTSGDGDFLMQDTLWDSRPIAPSRRRTTRCRC